MAFAISPVGETEKEENDFEEKGAIRYRSSRGTWFVSHPGQVGEGRNVSKSKITKKVHESCRAEDEKCRESGLEGERENNTNTNNGVGCWLGGGSGGKKKGGGN